MHVLWHVVRVDHGMAWSTTVLPQPSPLVAAAPRLKSMTGHRMLYAATEGELSQMMRGGDALRQRQSRTALNNTRSNGSGTGYTLRPPPLPNVPDLVVPDCALKACRP